MTADDCWIDIWSQLPEGVQRQIDRGDLRLGIECEDVTGKPRLATFSTPDRSRSICFPVQEDGRLWIAHVVTLILWA